MLEGEKIILRNFIHLSDGDLEPQISKDFVIKIRIDLKICFEI